MEFSGNIVFYLILGVVAVALVIAMQFAVRGHNEKLRAWAEARGYEFQPAARVGTPGVTTWRMTLDGRHDGVWFRRYSAFVPFSFNSNQRVYESLVREDGDQEWRIFRFFSHAAGSDNVDSWRVWVCAVEGPWDFPSLHLCPTKPFDKVKAALGMRDIETGDREFDAAFSVQCDSADFARSFLNDELRKFLLEMGSYRWQLGGRFVVLLWPGFSSSVKDIELMEFAMKRFQQLTSLRETVAQ
jgi:hypothetical protein